VIGGVLTSTFFTLVVVPVVYEAVESRLARWSKRRAERKAALTPR
jgi:Cu/Ag efflux pump CusA